MKNVLIVAVALVMSSWTMPALADEGEDVAAVKAV